MTTRTPRGIRNNNPGNIRLGTVRWKGEIEGEDDAFCTFIDPEHGIRALAKLLLNYQRRHRLRTVAGIIHRWAPAADDNDTDSYVAHVALALGVDAYDFVDLEDGATLRKLVLAIIQHECGQQPYDTKQIDDGIRMAAVG